MRSTIECRQSRSSSDSSSRSSRTSATSTCPAAAGGGEEPVGAEGATPGGTGEAEACALPKIADMMLPKILMGQLHCERAPRSPSIADPGHLLTHPRDFVNRP